MDRQTEIDRSQETESADHCEDKRCYLHLRCSPSLCLISRSLVPFRIVAAL